MRSPCNAVNRHLIKAEGGEIWKPKASREDSNAQRLSSGQGLQAGSVSEGGFG